MISSCTHPLFHPIPNQTTSTERRLLTSLHMEWVGGKAKSIDRSIEQVFFALIINMGRLVYADSVLYTEDTSSTLTHP